MICFSSGPGSSSRGWSQPQLATFAAPAAEAAARLLRRQARRVRRAGSDLAALSVTRRHELRIALKKLRYGADFFRSLFGTQRSERYLRSLSRLQDTLGAFNDVATARHLLETLKPPGNRGAALLARACGLVLGWHAHAAAEREQRLRGHWQDFCEARPFWPTT